jgi:hypothetical protein
MMQIALVSIGHPRDPDAEIPFIGCRGPIHRVALEDWKVRSLIDQGYTVEVHSEIYDPVAAHNTAVEAAAALAEKDAPAAEVVETAAEVDETAEPLTAEEIAELRSRIEGLNSLVEARQLLVELGVDIQPPPTKLKDIKTQLLAMLDE